MRLPISKYIGNNGRLKYITIDDFLNQQASIMWSENLRSD